jgi:hypothetical protein
VADHRADAAGAAFPTIASSQGESVKEPSASKRSAKKSARKIPTWALVVGGGVWTAAVIVFGVLLFSWIGQSDKNASPGAVPSVAPTASTAQAAPNPSQPSAPPATTPVRDQRHAELALKTGPEAKLTADPGAMVAKPGAGHAEPARQPDRVDPPKPETVAHAPAPAEESRHSASSSKSNAFPEPTRFKFGPLARKPMNVKEKLDKVLESPHSHLAKVVIPAGMYELARSNNDRIDGPRKYDFTERRFESPSNRPGAKFYLISGATTEVEVEPRLAARLDALNTSQWDKKPAILTLGITESGECGVVALQILENSYPRLRGGMVPDIVYETLDVSADGSKPAIGNDKDWESERVFKLAKYYKGHLRAIKQQFENMQMSQVQRQMGNIWANVMREAAAQDAAQRALQRGVGGR